MSDRVQVVLWREMGETTFSLVGLGDHPAGLGFRLLCFAVAAAAAATTAAAALGRTQAGWMAGASDE